MALDPVGTPLPNDTPDDTGGTGGTGAGASPPDIRPPPPARPRVPGVVRAAAVLTFVQAAGLLAAAVLVARLGRRHVLHHRFADLLVAVGLAAGAGGMVALGVAALHMRAWVRNLAIGLEVLFVIVSLFGAGRHLDRSVIEAAVALATLVLYGLARAPRENPDAAR